MSAPETPREAGPTPGPWWACRIEKSDCDDPLCTGIYDSEGVGIFYANGNREVARANAVLAAAAPAMLDALERVMKDCASDPDHPYDNGGPTVGTLDRVRAAIAAARQEGEGK